MEIILKTYCIYYYNRLKYKMSVQEHESSQIGEYIHTETKPLKFLNGADCVHVYKHPQP